MDDFIKNMVALAAFIACLDIAICTAGKVWLLNHPNEQTQFEIVQYDEQYDNYTMRDKTTDTMYIKSNDKYTQMLDDNGEPVTYDAWCSTNRNDTSKGQTPTTKETDDMFDAVFEDKKGVKFLKEKKTNTMFMQSGNNRVQMLNNDGKPLSYELWVVTNQ